MKNSILSPGKKIAVYAVSAAIIAVSTFLIRIPAVAGGYINFGDTFIFVFAYVFGPLSGLIAGGLGSALADLFAGYAVWAPFTLIIKGLEGWLCGILCHKLKKSSEQTGFIPALISFVAAAAVMAVGYYFASAILLKSFAGAIASIPENLVQGSVSVAAALIILFALRFKNFRIK